MTDGRITLEELRAQFGSELPIEVCNLLFDSPPDWTIEKVREEVAKFAAKHKRPAQMTDRKKLREAAMRAMDPNCRVDDASTFASFKALCTPETILSLLDDLDRPVGEVVALKDWLRDKEDTYNSLASTASQSREKGYAPVPRHEANASIHKAEARAYAACRAQLAALAPSPAIGRETRSAIEIAENVALNPPDRWTVEHRIPRQHLDAAWSAAANLIAKSLRSQP